MIIAEPPYMELRLFLETTGIRFILEPIVKGRRM